MKPSIIVHGGAWSIPDAAVAACRAGCQAALAVAWPILERGGSSLDAVEAAIVSLEEHPEFDAGIGSHLNAAGRVALDAILMEGQTLKAGAVAVVERIRNPIRLARKILQSSEHLMLVGAGAEKFAVEQGMALCDPEELITARERRAWQQCSVHGHRDEFHFSPGTPGSPSSVATGTVGAVAMDSQGRIVAGTSTGGTCCKRPGRVGDSPLIGCGCYADEQAGGISCTGWGEAIMKVVLAKTAADLLRAGYESTGEPEGAAFRAAQKSIEILAVRTQGTGGLILLDRAGRVGFAHSTPRMAYGYVAPDGSFITSV
ncbi:MAG: peptidase T [Acidipila sp.]|nr:peptidase T [Acidipila sp.]